MKKIKLFSIVFVIFVCLLNNAGMFGMDSGHQHYGIISGLLSTPYELLYDIFFQHGNRVVEIKELKCGIKDLLNLRSACKQTYSLLTHQKIREMCKDCNIKNKNELLKSVSLNRSSALALMYAGANSIREQKEWYKDAVMCSNVEITKILLEFGADPNQRYAVFGPILFIVRTIKIAKLLIAKGANAHFIHGDDTILDECFSHNRLPELIKFYITEHKVDATR